MVKIMTDFCKRFENRVFEFIFQKTLFTQINRSSGQNQYKFFRTENGIQEWGLEYSRYFQSLSPVPSTLISDSFSFELEAIHQYSGFTGLQINDLLRGKSFTHKREYLEKFIYQIDDILNNFRLRDNLIAIRKMSSKYIDDKYKRGNIFIEKGFLSTSLNLSYRKNINGESAHLHKDAILLIKIPKGTKAAYIEEAISVSNQRKEYELLLQRNLSFFVERNIKILSNRIIVLRLIES